MFRVYNNKERKWVKKNVYLSPNGELFLIKQSLFGMVKVPLTLSSHIYTYHRDINLYDKDGMLVYEGDYILAKVAEDKEVVGFVVYAHELSAYVILCVDSDEFYTLGSETTEFIKVIGNVFDGYKKEKKDGKPTLSESKE